MKTAVIYARYSSDLQKDRSIDDQIAHCRQIAKRNGFKVVEIFMDRGKSGASMFERDGLLALMTAAKQKKFEVVITESLSRLSRSSVDMPAIHERLKFNGVGIIDTNGEATDIHVGVGGIVNSQFLKNLATSVKRGRDARAREGLIPGKPAYGYRCIPGKPGVKEIVPEAAKIVRRIFEEYANGISTRTICEGLMAEGIISPSGTKLWNHGKLITGGAFGGMLGNQLYIGRLIWNAFYQIKNPENGKRINRKSKEAPIEVEVPQYRIIPQELWDRAQAMRRSRSTARANAGPRVSRIGDRDRLLLGLLRCATCGGLMMVGQSNTDGTPRVVCSYGARRMNCNHHKSYSLKLLTDKMLEDVKERLTDPKRLIAITRAYHERYAERQRSYRGERENVQKDLNRVTVAIDRTVTAIGMIDDDPVEALVQRLKALRVEQASLKQRLELVEAKTNVVTLHPAAIDKFTTAVKEVHKALTSDLDEDEIAPFHHAFRNIISSVVVHPTPKRASYKAEPILRISAITSGFEINPKSQSLEEMLAEQGVDANRIASPTGNYTDRERNSETLISLGIWRLAA